MDGEEIHRMKNKLWHNSQNLIVGTFIKWNISNINITLSILVPTIILGVYI